MESLHLNDNAQVVLQKRYLLRDAEGHIAESPEGLFQRVARAIAEGDLAYGATTEAVDALAETFYKLLARLDFLPNSPTLMNAGKPGGQLSACFVLPVPDSLAGIFDTLKHAALIHQSGGGTGFAFSRLRPEGDVLSFTSGVTSGPLSFMEVYNAATEAVKQGGTRRGANMGILRIDHPDIEAFIRIKNDLTRLTNFNISVAVTDAFMTALEDDAQFDLIHPNTQAVAKSLPARELMQQIVSCAWRTGEPGLIFIDRINAENVTPGVGEMESTNPCGEVPLLPYEACNLGSINMGNMLKPNGDGQYLFDWDHFEETIHWGVHFLENVIVQNNFPVDEIKIMVEGNRKIGLGLMGWADMLMKLGIPYNSEEALRWADKVMAFMNYHSKRASMALAQSRGRFAFFEKSVYTEGTWFQSKYHDATDGIISPEQWTQLDADILTHGLRHATTICLAPTGTISIIAGASGGIEPLFALVFLRNIMDNTELIETNLIFKAALEKLQLQDNAELLKDIALHGGVQHLTAIPKALKRIFVTAHDIAPVWHVRMQAAFQKHSDNAVSKTINFPETATMDDIKTTYALAYEMGLKGITVYRDNSRMLQPMSLRAGERLFAPEPISAQYCPECQKPLQKMEGCLQCPDCQYAFCG